MISLNEFHPNPLGIFLPRKGFVTANRLILVGPAAVYLAIFFGALSLVFLIGAVAHGTPPARKIWLRIGLIFALVALATFNFRPK